MIEKKIKKTIHLRQSSMPSLNDLTPYFRVIDKNKRYTNRSELLIEFENRLASHFNINPENLIVTSSGFTALSIGLSRLSLKLKDSKKKYCIVPTFTFIGTISSIINAGLIPYFVDISNNDYCLSIDSIQKEFKNKFDNVAAICPVGTFGILPNIKDWKNFEKKIKIPVIYDLAWNFDNFPDQKINAMFSLHATKVLGSGEGGILIFKEKSIKKDLIAFSNFGLNKERQIINTGINAKQSEYHAAVGLASLDNWPKIKKKILSIQDKYINFFDSIKHFTLMQKELKKNAWMSATIISSKKNIDILQKEFQNSNIECRKWWGNLCHQNQIFENFPCKTLDKSIHISKSHLNIPFHASLQNDEINRIFSIMQKVDNQV